MNAIVGSESLLEVENREALPRRLGAWADVGCLWRKQHVVAMSMSTQSAPPPPPAIAIILLISIDSSPSPVANALASIDSGGGAGGSLSGADEEGGMGRGNRGGGVHGGDTGGGEGGGGATTSGTTARPEMGEAADSTLTPRLKEMAEAGCAASCVAAASTEAAVAAAAAAALAPPPVGASGIARTTVTATLAPLVRRVMKHRGSSQLRLRLRLRTSASFCALSKELMSPAIVRPSSITVDGAVTMASPTANGANGG